LPFSSSLYFVVIFALVRPRFSRGLAVFASFCVRVKDIMP
jgi:hypothetical protein